jgi:hypothetical protein
LAIGWFGEDLWDAITDVVTSVADTSVDVLKSVPGGAELAGAVDDFMTGPMRDFAKTPAGMLIWRAAAGALYGPLAWQIGPQVASFMFALPGLARGQDFADAWFDEVRYRAETTAEILAPGLGTVALSPLQQAIAKLPLSGLLNKIPTELFAMPLKDIARELGIDDHWAVAMALSGQLPEFPVPDIRDFVDVTGNGAWRAVRGWWAAHDVANTTIDLSKVPEGDRLTVWSDRQTIARDAAARNPLLALNVGRSGGVVMSAPPSPSYAVTAPVEEPEPFPMPVGSSSAASRKRTGDIALAAVIAAGVVTFGWWYRGQK